jgi:ABC-type branched-subunit amino acid transport system permease subunit
MCHIQYLYRLSGKTIAIAFFIALSWFVIIALGAWSFMHSNQDLNNHTNVSVISLEIFYSRPLNLHLLYLVCVVNITFCCSFVFEEC